MIDEIDVNIERYKTLNNKSIPPDIGRNTLMGGRKLQVNCRLPHHRHGLQVRPVHPLPLHPKESRQKLQRKTS